MKADKKLLKQLVESGQQVSLDLTDNTGFIQAHVYRATILNKQCRFVAQWLPEDCDKPSKDGWAYERRPVSYHSWCLIYSDGIALYRNLTPLSGNITLGGL